MTEIIKKRGAVLSLGRDGKFITLTLSDDGSLSTRASNEQDMMLTLAEARVLLVELERAIEAAMGSRSEWVTE